MCSVYPCVSERVFGPRPRLMVTTDAKSDRNISRMCWGLSNVSYHGDSVLVNALVQYLLDYLPSLDVRDFTNVAWSLVVFGLELVRDICALQMIVVHATKFCTIAKRFDHMDQSAMQLCEFVSYAVGMGMARAPTTPWCVEHRPGGYISRFRSDIYRQVCVCCSDLRPNHPVL